MKMKYGSKGLSFVLALALIFSTFAPLSVFATDTVGGDSDQVITGATLTGLTPPDGGAEPVSEAAIKVDATTGTGVVSGSAVKVKSITWTPKVTEGAVFAYDTTYSAVITLEPVSGFAFSTGTAITVTVGGLSVITTPAITSSAVVKVEFPKTGSAPDPVETKFDVKLNLSNLTGPAVTQVTSGGAFEETIAPKDGYKLPDTITVEMGGTSFNDYTYDKKTGKVKIEKVTSNASITADGVEMNDDATLSKLQYRVGDGEVKEIDGFSKTVTTPAVELPYNTSKDAKVTLIPTKSDMYATITANAGVTLSNGIGSAVVKVTAENKETEETYKVNFTIKNPPKALSETSIKEAFSPSLQKYVGEVVLPDVTSGEAIGTAGAITIAAVTSIDLTSSSAIDDLSGIEYFTGLKELKINQDATQSGLIYGVKMPTGLSGEFSSTDASIKYYPESRMIGLDSKTRAASTDNISYKLGKNLTVSVTVNTTTGPETPAFALVDKDLQPKFDSSTQESANDTITLNASGGAFSSADTLTKSAFEFSSSPTMALPVEGFLVEDVTKDPTTGAFTVDVNVKNTVENGTYYLFFEGKGVGAVTVEKQQNWSSGGGSHSSSTYSVTFDSMGGSSVSSQRVSRGEKVKKPSDPKRDGYTFDGWYTDKKYNTKYDFGSTVSRSFTLYAKWTEGDSDDVFSNFTDVSSHWAKDSIKFAVDKGLFYGTSKTKFSPDMSMTRGMFVTVLGRLDGIDPKGTANFSDVKSSMYYSPYIAWASSNNIVAGTGDNKFSPEDQITREEMAVMLYNYAKYIKKADYKAIDLDYKDTSSISKWAKEGMEFAASTEIMVGKPGNLADPKGLATRAEVAQLFKGFTEYIAK